MTDLVPPEPPSDDMQQPTFKRGRRYTTADLEPIFKGLVAMPNIEPVSDYGRFLNNLAAVGHTWAPQWGWSLRYDQSRDSGRKQWTQFFLRPGEGTGYAVIYCSYNEPEGALVVTFAICKHEKEDHPDADHSHGWHPGHCRKCGMDMSYDSGD